MTIDWSHFTPISALAGGVLIGLSAAWLLLVDGRVLGASGLLGGLIPPRRGDWEGRAAALFGLILAPTVARAFHPVATPSLAAGATTLLVAGLLVGFGTRLANGCTSGHGVCGLARLSKRSFAAVVSFMAAAFATVFVVRHVL